MNTVEVLIAIGASWIASVLAFPILPFQHWLNSRLGLVWRMATFRPRGLTGTWIAVYDLPSRDGGVERMSEVVSCSQLNGGEVRGTIKDEATGARYRFLGRIVFDELVAHYWAAGEESRDIGNFKFRIEADRQVLHGVLTVLDSNHGETRSGITYTWRRCPTRLRALFRNVRGGRSAIDRSGLFADARFSQHQRIGSLRLSRAEQQGEHTIKFKDRHYLVKKPWRNLNHACEPNCTLEWKPDQIVLVARRDILPQEELTIDYLELPERIGSPFRCRCPKHGGLSDAPMIGGQ